MKNTMELQETLNYRSVATVIGPLQSTKSTIFAALQSERKLTNVSRSSEETPSGPRKYIAAVSRLACSTAMDMFEENTILGSCSSIL